MSDPVTQNAFRKWASGLRFPQLLLLTLALLGVDILVPDMIPLIDEALLALTALLLGSLKKQTPVADASDKPPEKNVTERGHDSSRPPKD